MQLPNRSFSVENSAYRFGFNGMEKDDEVKGSGNAIEYGGRSIYDSRLGRFLSIDPKYKEFPYWTPYLFASNKPIWAIDQYGLGPIFSNDGVLIGYEVEPGQGFTQIAKDLNENYLPANKKIVWYKIAEYNYDNFVEFYKCNTPNGPLIYDSFNPSLEETKNFLHTGMVLGISESMMNIEPEPSKMDLNYKLKLDITGVNISASFVLGGGVLSFGTDFVPNDYPTFERGVPLTIDVSGLSLATPGLNLHIGSGSITFHNLIDGSLSSTIEQSLTTITSKGFSYGGSYLNYNFLGKNLKTGEKTFSMNINFFGIGLKGPDGSFNTNNGSEEGNFTVGLTYPRIDTIETGKALYNEFGIKGKYLNDKGFDTLDLYRGGTPVQP